jgi:hypothetical protein
MMICARVQFRSSLAGSCRIPQRRSATQSHRVSQEQPGSWFWVLATVPAPESHAGECGPLQKAYSFARVIRAQQLCKACCQSGGPPISRRYSMIRGTTSSSMRRTRRHALRSDACRSAQHEANNRPEPQRHGSRRSSGADIALSIEPPSRACRLSYITSHERSSAAIGSRPYRLARRSLSSSSDSVPRRSASCVPLSQHR